MAVDPFNAEFERRSTVLDGIVERTVKKQDKRVETIFEIRTEQQRKDEGINCFLPLSDRHYLILNGEISGTQTAAKFARLIHELVRAVILEFSTEETPSLDETLIARWKKLRPRVTGATNFLFYIIKSKGAEGKNEKLEVYLAISGRGLSGKENYSKQHELCQNILVVAVSKIVGYDITGVFIPFSREEARTVPGTCAESTQQFKEILAKRRSNFIKTSFITKFLRHSIRINYHTEQTLLSNIEENRGDLIEYFNRARECRKRIEDRIWECKKRNDGDQEESSGSQDMNRSKQWYYEPTELIDSLTLTFLKDIAGDQLTEMNQADGERSSFSYQEIQENVGFLEKQSDLIHFKRYEGRVETFKGIDEFDDMRNEYEESLKQIWEKLKEIRISNVMNYQAHCSEDNLIDYLTFYSDILRKSGTHFIFSVKMWGKGEGGGTEAPKAISIRPPCSFCMIRFPLKFADIAQRKAGLPHSAFGKTIPKSKNAKGDPKEMRIKLTKISFDDKLLYTKNFEQRIFELFFKICEDLQDELGPQNTLDWRMLFISPSEQSSYNGQEIFHEITRGAATFGKTHVIRLLRVKEVCINAGCEGKNTYLNAAIQNNHLETVKELIEFEEIKATLKSGKCGEYSSFCLAASYPRTDVFIALWNASGGGEEFTKLFFWKLLDKAVCYADFGMVSEIYDKLSDYCEASFQMKLDKKLSVLNHACKRGDYETCKHLVNGIHFEDAIRQPGPLLSAIKTCHEDVAILLCGKEEVKKSKSMGAFHYFEDSHKFAALYFASHYDLSRITKKLRCAWKVEGELFPKQPRANFNSISYCLEMVISLLCSGILVLFYALIVLEYIYKGFRDITSMLS